MGQSCQCTVKGGSNSELLAKGVIFGILGEICQSFKILGFNRNFVIGINRKSELSILTGSIRSIHWCRNFISESYWSVFKDSETEIAIIVQIPILGMNRNRKLKVFKIGIGIPAFGIEQVSESEFVFRFLRLIGTSCFKIRNRNFTSSKWRIRNCRWWMCWEIIKRRRWVKISTPVPILSQFNHFYLSSKILGFYHFYPFLPKYFHFLSFSLV